jgi:TAP-like protein
VLPLFLFGSLYDDSEAGRVRLAEALRVFTGATATPTPALQQFLDGYRTGSGAATDRSGTPILCADRAVSRDPGRYYRDIQAHRATEPLFGPLTRNITPCSFWPVRGEEPTTTIRNAAPALIVAATGDPAAPYPGQQAMHRALTGSRMLTLRGGFGHGQYLVAGNTCVDDRVTGYLTGEPLPARDGECSA